MNDNFLQNVLFKEATGLIIFSFKKILSAKTDFHHFSNKYLKQNYPF